MKEEAVLSPEIVAVDRVAVCGDENATLRAMGLGSTPFSVMLRGWKSYTELEVVSEDLIDSETKMVTVRYCVPAFRLEGYLCLLLEAK